MNKVEGGGKKERGREQATTDTSLLSQIALVISERL